MVFVLIVIEMSFSFRRIKMTLMMPPLDLTEHSANNEEMTVWTRTGIRTSSKRKTMYSVERL